MRIFQTTVLALVTASVSASVPTRPTITLYPKQPSLPFPCSPPRNPSRVCTVASGSADAGPAILAAAKKCNKGGTVYFPAGQNYTIATVLDLTFLANIDFAILGNIKFKDDLTYWQAHAFQYAFQSASLFWRFGGHDVNIYGLGIGSIDGKSFLQYICDLETNFL
jgi:galacturan 1,4-alpha-galacturonidase